MARAGHLRAILPRSATRALAYAALSRYPTRVLVHDGAGEVAQDQDLGRGAGERCTPGERWLVVGEGEEALLRHRANQVRAMIRCAIALGGLESSALLWCGCGADRRRYQVHSLSECPTSSADTELQSFRTASDELVAISQDLDGHSLSVLEAYPNVSGAVGKDSKNPRRPRRRLDARRERLRHDEPARKRRGLRVARDCSRGW